MKILALYDIHGNIDALEAVLTDPRAGHPDAVVIGGDAVPGPRALATLDRLRAITGSVEWVGGNGEREVAQAAGGEPAAEDMAVRTAAITAREIGERQSRALADLPLTVELDGVLVLPRKPAS